MTTHETLAGIDLKIIDPYLGKGAQGQARKVTLIEDETVGLVAKSLSADTETVLRTKHLCGFALPLRNPFLAAPFVFDQNGNSSIRHLAPFADGKPLNEDILRTFPERIEIAHHLACNWCVLEENGLAHGDIRLPHIVISKRGETKLLDFDNIISANAAIPPPPMAGDRMIMAPEIRLKKSPPSIESDRFAYAVWYHMLLLQRHPTDAVASTPAELDKVMSDGIWPERNRQSQPDEVPAAALGAEILLLFDQAFSANPTERPSGDQWRRAFSQALKNLYIHDCNEAFVAKKGQKQCPWCLAEVSLSPDVPVLKISLPHSGTRYVVPLTNNTPIALGRGNLTPCSAAVSGRHLEIFRQNDQLLLRHLGSNQTLIEHQGSWYQLEEVWLPFADLSGKQTRLKLADMMIELSVEY